MNIVHPPQIPANMRLVSIENAIYGSLNPSVICVFSFISYRCNENKVLIPSRSLSLVSLMVQDSIDLLLDAVRTSNEDLAQTWKKSEQWATIEQLCSESSLLACRG